MAYNDWNIHGDVESRERYADFKAHHSADGQKPSKRKIWPLIVALCFLAGMIILYAVLVVKN